MENVFYDRQISRIYDLKGSERSRFNADAAANPQDAGEVHLDDNLRRSNLQVSWFWGIGVFLLTCVYLVGFDDVYPSAGEGQLAFPPFLGRIGLPFLLQRCDHGIGNGDGLHYFGWVVLGGCH